MTINPEAIKKFLNQPAPYLPAFKGEPASQLRRLIYDSTGSNYQAGRTSPRQHQLEGIAFALYRRRSLLLYWMRLGKSLMALHWSEHLRRAGLLDPGRKGLILAHAPIACQVWRTQAALHSDLDVRTIESDQEASREDQLLDALDSDCDLIVMPPTTVQLLFTIKKLSRKEEPKLYPNRDWLADAARAFSHVIIDEIHIYSNPFALRTELVRLLIAGCKQRVGLTGTPIGRNPFDLWAQAWLIDEGKTFGYNFMFFREAFGKKKSNYFGRELVFDKGKMATFQDKLGSLALAYGKGELKSAEVFAGDIELSMPEEQRTAYEEVIDKAVNLDGYDEIEIKAIFHRLRQVAAGYLPFDHDQHGRLTVHFDGSIKLRWMAEMLDAMPAGVQVLIFHEYTHSGELICKVLSQAKLTHAWLRGGEGDRRNDKVVAFQTGEAQVLVAQSRVGGTSLDLPQADYVLMFECPVSPRDYEQAIARPMARGDRPLMLDHLIAAPVDRKILDAIKDGRDLSDEIIRSGHKFFADLRAR